MSMASRLPGGLRTAFLLLAVAGLAVVAVWIWQTPRVHQVEVVEVAVLDIVLGAKQGRPLYAYPDGLDIVANPYGPLFEWLCLKLPWSAASPYRVGRLISLLATAATLGAFATWARRRSGLWWPGVLAAALFVTTKPAMLFAPLYRVDMLALALGMLGFCSLLLWPSRGSLVPALLLFTAAFTTKVTAIAAPAAAVLYLLEVDRRKAVGLLVGLAAAFGTSLLVLQSLTDGAFLFQSSFGNLNIRPLKSLEMVSRTALSAFWIAALLVLHRTQHRSRPLRALLAQPAAIYAACALLVAAVFAINAGTSWNFLMDFYLALGLLTCDLIAPRRAADGADGSEEAGRAALPTLPARLLTLHAVVTVVIVASVLWDQVRGHQRYAAEYREARALLEPVVAAGREVLVLDSVAGRDALNGLGKPNSILVPFPLERTLHGEIRATLDGMAEPPLVFAGPDLAPWTPEP